MQILKEEVREQILAGALDCFYRLGYRKTSISRISKECGVSVGNIYNYYKSKDELFYTVVSPAVIENIKTILISKIRSVSGTNLSKNYVAENFELMNDELLSFLADNQKLLVIVLNKADYTKFEGVKGEIASLMINLFTEYAASLGKEVPVNKKMLLLIYTNLIRALGLCLEAESDREKLKHNLKLLLRYHLMGIGGFQ